MSISSKAHIVYLNQAGIDTALAELKYLGSVADDTERDNLGGLVAGNVISVTNSADSNNTPAIYHFNGTTWDTIGSEYIVNSVISILADRYSATQIDALLLGLGIYAPVANVAALNAIATPQDGFICVVKNDAGKQVTYQRKSGVWVKLVDEDTYSNVTQLLADVQILQGVSASTQYWKEPVADLAVLVALPTPLVGEIRAVISGIEGNPTLYRYTTQWDVFNAIPSVAVQTDLMSYTLLAGSTNQIVLVLETKSFWFYLQGTGWQEIGGSAGGLYTNSTPTPQTVGGILAGSTFLSKTTQEMFDALLYPYTLPFVTGFDASVAGEELQSGTKYLRNGTSITNVEFDLFITPKSELVSKIEYYVGGILMATDNVSYSLPTSVNKNVSVTFTGVDTALICSTIVYDNIGGTVVTDRAIYFSNRLFFFTDSDNFIDLAFTPAAIGTMLQSLDSTKYDFQQDRFRDMDTFTPISEYIYYVWNAAFGDTIPPVQFQVNGLPNTAWQKRILNYTNNLGQPISAVMFRSQYKLNNTFNIKVR